MRRACLPHGTAPRVCQWSPHRDVVVTFVNPWQRTTAGLDLIRFREFGWNHRNNINIYPDPIPSTPVTTYYRSWVHTAYRSSSTRSQRNYIPQTNRIPRSAGSERANAATNPWSSCCRSHISMPSAGFRSFSCVNGNKNATFPSSCMAPFNITYVFNCYTTSTAHSSVTAFL